MTDHLSWETLNDLVDGVLSPAASAAAESHVGGCVACANALAELRATVVAAHELPGDVTPPDDLWSDVRATIEARKVAHLPSGAGPAQARGWWITPGRLAAAAVVLIVGTASLTGVVMSSRSSAAGVARAQAPATVSVSWQASERAFQASVLELREQLEVLHDHLSPETVVKVERALATIDLAIAEGREALLRDPANAALSELLASNYRQKIELLRRMTQLASST
jgi:anti-sigma factor RsiW